MHARFLIISVLLYLSILPFTAKSQDWKSLIDEELDVTSTFAEKPILIVFEEAIKLADIESNTFKIIRRVSQNAFVGIIKKPIQKNGVKVFKLNNHWKYPTGIKPSSSQDAFKIHFRSKGKSRKKTSLVESSELEYWATHPEVIFIEPVRQPSVESRVLDLNLNVNNIHKLHQTYPQLKGQGQTISIQELMYDTTDLDLLTRHIPSGLQSSGQNNHATDMATIIAGAGNTFITGKGVAPSASITSSDFSDVLPDLNESYEMLGVHVQNHSYGTQIENFYGSNASAFDKSAIERPTLLHVISSGNVGTESPNEGMFSGIDGFANLTGNFKQAKNTIVVGAVDTTHHHLNYSSKGPAFDGRIKPELVAYSMSGSSNAAAMVSGTIALMQQAYVDAYGHYPTSSIIKACLINSTIDAGIDGIDHQTGFGALNAVEAMRQLQAERIIVDSIYHDERKSYDISLPSNAVDLKITLVWNDVPANPGDFKALINDLDLTLKTPNQDIIKPWVLFTEPDSALLMNPAERGEDHLNNVEQISLERPQEGQYTIELKGYDVPDGKWPFCIVYNWDTLDSFEWNYPTGSAHFPYNGESGTYFRWKSTYENVQGDLQYSLEDTSNWQPIAQVDLNQGYYRWELYPKDYDGIAYARMTFEDEQFVSEPFIIAESKPTSVGFDCGDSIMFVWPKVEGAAYYQILHPNLKLGLMEPIYSLTDTFYILDPTDYFDSRFAIEPITSEGLKYLPSYTFDYRQIGGACILSSFFQEVVLDSGIFLNVNLSTTIGVEQIVFEKRVNGVFEEVDIIERPKNLSIRVLDSNPEQGHNVHRVNIYLQGGQVIQQVAMNTYFLTTRDKLVFPNPVDEGDFLNVYTKPLEGATEFRLYDRNGKEVYAQTLESSQSVIRLNVIPAGLYFYRISSEKESNSGRLIVR